MKRKISSIFIILLITALLSNAVAYAANPAAGTNVDTQRLKTMEKVADNGKLELYMDKSNTEIGVKVKSTGDIWFSNPADRESIEDPTAQSILGAHVSIIYYDATGAKLTQDSLTNSVEPETYKIKQIKNGIRVEYTFKNRVNIAVGQTVKLPKYKGKKGVDVDIVEDRGNKWGFMEKNKFDTVYMDKQKMIYMLQDQKFFIPVEYTIDDENMVAKIPCDQVKHPEQYPLSEINLIPYFGTARYTEKGYMFFPDGSGTLINFTKNTDTSILYKDMYGMDYANLKSEQLIRQEQGIMPIFGIKRENKAFLAIIEDGDAVSSITAEVGNFTHDYNDIHATFKVTPLGTITLAGAATPINAAVYQNRLYKGDIKVRYSFLSNKNADYVGMANTYRDYLSNKYKLKKIDAQKNIPLNLEVLGAIQKTKSVLGFPVVLTQPLTTFKQAEQMVEEVQKNGIDNINLKYSGWFNSGIKHTMPTSIAPVRALGGKSGFKKLISAMNEKNVKLYPDVDFQKIYSTGLFKFSKSRDSVRTLAQKIDKVFSFSFVTYGKDPSNSFWILNPQRIQSVVGKFMNSYVKYDNKALSLKDLGTDISSDFNKKNVIDRQQAKEYAEKEIKKLKESGIDLMLTSANIYAVPYASTVINAPVDSSNFNLVSETIPFFQIALHGYINYTGEPINMAQDYQTTLLRSIETGATPYYSLMYEDCSVVKNTRYTYFYSTNYNNWKNDMFTVYKELNTVLKDVQDQKIIGHKKLCDGVYQTTYESGKAVIVNYNSKAVDINGTKVKAKGYAILEGVEVE